MLDSILNPTTVPLLEQAAKFHERRHEVLVGNVANIDTPHYQRKDLDGEAFQDALASAIASRQPSPTRRYLPPPAPVAEQFAPALFQAQKPDPVNVTFQDGAERSIESEIASLTRTSLQQRFTVEVMASQLATLQAVIAESP